VTWGYYLLIWVTLLAWWALLGLMFWRLA